MENSRWIRRKIGGDGREVGSWVDFNKGVAKEGVYSGPLLGGASLALTIRAAEAALRHGCLFILPASGENLRVAS